MKTLYIFTAQYPFSSSESFLETEITYLVNKFQTIYIIPGEGKGERRIVPKNCIVTKPLNLQKRGKMLYYFRGLLCWKSIGIIIDEFFVNKVYRSKNKLIKWLSTSISLNNCLKNNTIKSIISSMQPNDVCYFYWGVGMNVLSIFLKNKAHLVSRFHGEWDLWEESSGGYAPYRQKIANSLDLAVFIAKKGEDYFKQRYNCKKTIVSRLGTINKESVFINKNKDVINIVSCSLVYPLKRVDLIYKALQLFDKINIQWTHIGEGVDFQSLKQLVQNSKNNVIVKLLGKKTNKQVLNFYKENPVDLFINVSKNEGIPVSIMEALSYNVPVIATDVGGNSEIVTPQSGILISSNPSPIEIKEAILNISNLSLSPREFWNDYYNADKNYTNFADNLYNL